jgi:hypothetical protein
LLGLIFGPEEEDSALFQNVGELPRATRRHIQNTVSLLSLQREPNIQQIKFVCNPDTHSTTFSGMTDGTERQASTATNKQTIKVTNQIHVSVFLWKPPVALLLKNFPTFYGTRSFTTVFTKVRRCFISWARRIQSTPSHPIRSYIVPCRAVIIQRVETATVS